ncbi:DUF6520 family protein [Flavobacterium ajazii]|uniref:DUF6520 family protein n=1 Tax=Flavobacterium ajazii TaxID=2692318 RepID=UPI0013D613EA|nr:DUF6520 family protein [Flavobacterium ajazii]
MKTIFSKQVLPVAVFALAIAGAFTTNAMERNSRSVDAIDGFKRLNPAGLCDDEQSYSCESVNTGAICRVSASPSSQQVYAKNANGACTVEVYRPQ